VKIRANDIFVTGFFSYTRHEASYNLRSPLNDVLSTCDMVWLKRPHKMTGAFWYYDKLDFDLKLSNAHFPFTSPISTLLAAWEGSWLVPRAQSSLVIYAVADRSQETDTTFRRRKRREKTPLVPPSYLSRAHSKTEDSGFQSQNFPDSKSGLPFIHGTIKTYILNVFVSSGSL